MDPETFSSNPGEPDQTADGMNPERKSHLWELPTHLNNRLRMAVP